MQRSHHVCIATILALFLMVPWGGWDQAWAGYASGLTLERPSVVWAGALLPDGDRVIGGWFNLVNGQPRENLARLNPDGSLDTAWTQGCDGSVMAALVAGTHLYIGGSFHAVGGQPCVGLGRLDITTGQLTPAWTNLIDGEVNALATDGTNLYVGGTFEQTNGMTFASLARFSLATGAADPAWTNRISGGSVRALAWDNGRLYAGGRFTNVNGSLRQFIACFDGATGALDNNWTNGADGGVNVILPTSAGLFIGGEFATVGGAPRQGLARLLPANGAADPAWTNNFNAPYALAADDQALYAADGHLVRFDLQTGARLSEGGWNIYGTPYDMEMQGSNVWMAGNFLLGGDRPRYGCGLVVGATGGVVPGYTARAMAGGVVSTLLTLPGGQVIAGGEFDVINGFWQHNLALLEEDGTVNTVWSNSVNGPVTCLAAEGTDVFVGGQFYAAGNLTRFGLAKMRLPDGAVDPAWSNDTDGSIADLAIWQTNLYVAGDFTNLGQAAFAAIGCVDRYSGAPRAGWTNGCDGVLQSLVVTNGFLYAAGLFSEIGGGLADMVGRLDLQTGVLDPSWTNGAGYVFPMLMDMAAGEGHLYLGGYFEPVTGPTNLLRLDLNTGAVDLNWAPSPDGPVAAILPRGPVVYIGGGFYAVGGVAVSNIGRVQTSSGVLDSGWIYSTDWEVRAVQDNGYNQFVGGDLFKLGPAAAYGLGVVHSLGRLDQVVPDFAPMVGGTPVILSGLNLGNGTDITNVTLCSIMATIVTQRAGMVEVLAGGSYSACTGDVRVFSASMGETVKSNAFAYSGVSTQHFVLAQAGAHGSIAPAGLTPVTHGGTLSWVITAETNYYIDRLLANGQPVPAAIGWDRFVFSWSNITANSTADVRFAGCQYSLAPFAVTIPFEGGDGTFEVGAAAGCAWSARDAGLGAWLTVMTNATGIGTGTVQYLAAPNWPGAGPRTGLLYVANEVFTAVQDGAGSSVGAIQAWLEPTNIAAVTTWSVYPWVYTALTNGEVRDSLPAGTYTVGFRQTLPGYMAPGTQSVLVVSGQVTVVTGRYTACSYQVAPQDFMVPSTGAMAAVTVTPGSPACYWNCGTPSAAWITVQGLGAGQGTGTVSLAVAANSDLYGRTGTVSVADQMVTIRQAAGEPRGIPWMMLLSE